MYFNNRAQFMDLHQIWTQ